MVVESYETATRGVAIMIILSEEEYESLRIWAGACGLTPAQYLQEQAIVRTKRTGRRRMPPPTTFARTLGRILDDRKMSYNQVARLAGMSQSGVSRIMQGLRQPSRKTVELLSAGLGLGPLDHNILLNSAGYLAQPPRTGGDDGTV